MAFSIARAGPYELLKQLSSGGSGEVYVARRADTEGPGGRIAVKWLLPYLASEPEMVTRFLDEVRLVARMRHPNIVSIFDVGMSDGRPWLAMELVEGVTLHTLLARCRAGGEQLPLSVVRLIAAGLLDALTYAHTLATPQVLPREQSGPLAGRARVVKPESLQVIHRDVSPSNVLISLDGAVRLTDFGLARATINWAKTSPGGLGGIKVGYTAPEVQLGGAAVDQRADVFGAGVTLFEALTLQHPYRRPQSSDVQTLEAVAKGDALKASAARAGVSPEVDAALFKALRPAANERHGSTAELKAALVDGEVAPAGELGARVRRLCAEELAQLLALDEGATDPGEVPTATTMVTGENKTVVVSPAEGVSRRTLAVAGGAAALAGLGLIGLWRVLARAPSAPPAELQLPEEVVLEQPVDAGAPAEVPDELELSPTEEHAGYVTAEGDAEVPVLLDGKPLGTTPLLRVSVPPGKHVLTFKTKRGDVKKKLVVVEGEDVTVRAGR